MSASYNKAKLVGELSDIAKVSRQRVEQMLSALAEIAAREAADGTDVLALCGLSNVGPTDAPTFSFKCPYCASVIEVPSDCAGQAADCPTCHRAFTIPFPTSSQRAAMTAATPSSFISFVCHTCGQEIEAPADLAGTAAECPGCGMTLTVPEVSDPGTSHGAAAQPGAGAAHAADATEKARTLRIELDDLQ